MPLPNRETCPSTAISVGNPIRSMPTTAPESLPQNPTTATAIRFTESFLIKKPGSTGFFYPGNQMTDSLNIPIIHQRGQFQKLPDGLIRLKVIPCK